MGIKTGSGGGGGGGASWSHIPAPFLWESCIPLSFHINAFSHPRPNFFKSCFPGAVKSQILCCFLVKSWIPRIPFQILFRGSTGFAKSFIWIMDFNDNFLILCTLSMQWMWSRLVFLTSFVFALATIENLDQLRRGGWWLYFVRLSSFSPTSSGHPLLSNNDFFFYQSLFYVCAVFQGPLIWKWWGGADK